MLRNWVLMLGLLLLWVGYFAIGPKPVQSDLLFIKDASLSNRLSHISTSPRWEYPFGNHNAISTKNKNNPYDFPESTIPIVSIEMEDNALFDYFSGIYIRGSREWESRKPETAWWDWPANYRNRGKEWEREATIRFIGFEGDPISQKAGIRINGNATRAFPQKSLRLVFREAYEKDGIENIFYTESSNPTFKTLLLRNGGNDWDRAFLRDVLTAELSSDLHFETQPAKAVNVYLNGEYWGLHYLRPKIDDDYLTGKYEIADTLISIIESPGKIYRGTDQGLNEFNAMLDFAQSKDLADAANFTKISQQLDMESFIDYLVINMLIVNTDWPQNNWLVWKDLSESVNNGKWKWILKDTDYGLGFFDPNAYGYNMFTKVGKNKGPIGILFNALLKNPDFKEQFKERETEIRATTWSITHFNMKLDSISQILQPEMQYQINRWRTHISVNSWKDEVEDMRAFYKKRLNN